MLPLFLLIFLIWNSYRTSLNTSGVLLLSKFDVIKLLNEQNINPFHGVSTQEALEVAMINGSHVTV